MPIVGTEIQTTVELKESHRKSVEKIEGVAKATLVDKYTISFVVGDQWTSADVTGRIATWMQEHGV